MIGTNRAGQPCDKRGYDDDSIASERIVVPVEGKRWFEHP